MNVEPRRLGRDDEPAAVSVLAEAFVADPLFVHLFGGIEHDERARQVRALLDGVVGMNRWSGGLRWGIDGPDLADTGSAGRLAAAALVEGPRVGGTRVRSGLALLRFLPVALSLPRPTVQLINRYGAAVRAAAPRTPHHYLTMIGVRAAYQGRGVASALLDAVFAASDADPASTGVALDTENEANLRLYRHKGFEMTSRHIVAGMRVFCMFRPSRRGRE